MNYSYTADEVAAMLRAMPFVEGDVAIETFEEDCIRESTSQVGDQ